MMCVNDTLPPRARERWLLMTIRLSQSSLTGTERTEVAVGTVRLASMFWAVRAGRTAQHREGGLVGGLGRGRLLGLLGHRGDGGRRRGAGVRARAGGGRGGDLRLRGAGRLGLRRGLGGGFAAGFARSSRPASPRSWPGSSPRSSGWRARPASAALVAPFVVPPEFPPGALCLKKSHHTLSTLLGVALVLLVHLVDQPLVRAERGEGVVVSLAVDGGCAFRRLGHGLDRLFRWFSVMNL